MVTAPPAQKMKALKQITVTKLFGTFDYTIPLNQDGTTILVGPCGFGKTMLLKLLNDLFGENDNTLQSIPFAEFRVDFDDDTALWVTKDKEQTKLTFHLRDEEQQEHTYTPAFLLRSDSATKQLSSVSLEDYSTFEANHPPEATERISPSGEILSSKDVVQWPQKRMRSDGNEIPEWLTEARKFVPVYFIDTQRLSYFLRTVKQNGSEIQTTVVPTVDAYAEELAERIRTKQTDIDRRIERLQAKVNQLFLFKKLSVNPEKGFVFTDTNGRVLSPHELSLGEQHVLALSYELLFKVAPGSLILLDEPEASLHVVWQKDFLQTLWGMGSRGSFLIVTHSPTLIRDAWDMVVPLEKAA